MICFERVRLGFGEQIVLEDISFSIGSGEKVVFQGESGSGKSTLLRAVAGARVPITGTIRVNGAVLSPETVNTIRRSIAFIGQEPVLGAEGVRDALLLPFTFKAHRSTLPNEARVADLLKALRLSPSILEQSSSDLSGGEKQRIAVARAVLLKKTIYLVDEITSALDPANKDAVMDVILSGDNTVVSISHDVDWIARCDRVFTVENRNLSETLPIGHR